MQEPLDIRSATEKDTAQNHAQNGLRIALGIEQAQCGPQLPPNSSQRSTPRKALMRSMSSMRWSVVLLSRDAKGVERPPAALIEEDNTEAFGVEEAPRGGGVTARAGAAMDNKNRYPLRVTGLFQVEECPSPTSRRWVA